MPKPVRVATISDAARSLRLPERRLDRLMRRGDIDTFGFVQRGRRFVRYVVDADVSALRRAN